MPAVARPPLQHAARIGLRLKGLMSVALTTGTAVLALQCIHFSVGGIQPIDAAEMSPAATPAATWEFAPLTTDMELVPVTGVAPSTESI